MPRSPYPNMQPDGHSAYTIVFKLFGWALLFEAIILLAFPIISRTTAANNPLKIAFFGLFSWIPQVDWTSALPTIRHFLASYPLIDPGQQIGAANLSLLCLLLAFIPMAFAAQLGTRSVREYLLPHQNRGVFWAIFLVTCLFAVTFLFLPAFNTREELVYAGYGRLVTVHHLNPYVAKITDLPSELLYPILSQNPQVQLPVGPVWMDLCIPISLLAHESVGNFMLSFRMMGLLAHLGNTLLIWYILSKLKPLARISGTILYAWNPLILLLGISEMHVEIFVTLLVLLGIFFFQHRSPSLGWIFLMLACMVNLFCLLLLPLFLYQMGKAAQEMHYGLRVLWVLGVAFITVLVVGLAYAPYWQMWGLAGLADQFQAVFWQHSLINSLDATLQYMPVKLPGVIFWLVAPQHWMLLAGVVCGLVLLFTLWLGDTLDLAVLFSSWLWLALLIFLPIYWPWYALLPLALAIASGEKRTIQLAMLLGLGALVAYYCWLWPNPWKGQALATVGLPLLLWGWVVFFNSTFQMTATRETEQRAPRTPQLRTSSWPHRVR